MTTKAVYLNEFAELRRSALALLVGMLMLVSPGVQSAVAQAPEEPSASAEKPGGLKPPVRYISDEMAITLRQDPGVEGKAVGLLKSGTRVELLQIDEQSGYIRVRAAPDQVGWVLGRFISEQPHPRARLAKLSAQLETRDLRIRELEGQLALARRNPSTVLIPEGAPAAVLEDPEPSGRTGMITGALIFAAGILFGLLFTLFPRRGRRGWADL